MSDVLELSPEPAAYQYRWKIDGEWVNWRYADYSQASKYLKGIEERPLYSENTIPAMLIEAERRGMMHAAEIVRAQNVGPVFAVVDFALQDAEIAIRTAAAELGEKP